MLAHRTEKRQNRRRGRGRSLPADTLPVTTFMRAIPEPASYILAGMERGWIDDALIDGDPKHVRSVALPMFLLVDEVAIWIARGALSPEDGAAIMRDLKPRLEDLWSAIREGEPITIRAAKKDDPEFNLELTFLRRAVDRYAAVTSK